MRRGWESGGLRVLYPLEGSGEERSLGAQSGRFSRLSHATVSRFNPDNNHTKKKKQLQDHRIRNLTLLNAHLILNLP